MTITFHRWCSPTYSLAFSHISIVHCHLLPNLPVKGRVECREREKCIDSPPQNASR